MSTFWGKKPLCCNQVFTSHWSNFKRYSFVFPIAAWGKYSETTPGMAQPQSERLCLSGLGAASQQAGIPHFHFWGNEGFCVFYVNARQRALRDIGVYQAGLRMAQILRI